MNKKDAKIKALSIMWGQATALRGNLNTSELSDYFALEVHNERCTEKEALKIQKEFHFESERLINRLKKLRKLK